jgi:hypothetical protein
VLLVGDEQAGSAPPTVVRCGHAGWPQRRPCSPKGLERYTDDRLADGVGWITFDVTDITCPVIVLHGGADVIADPVHARQTADRSSIRRWGAG